MGLWNTISKKAKGTVRKMFQGYYSQVYQIPPALNTQDYLIQYGKIGWLFACTSKVAQDVADTEWKAYRKGEEDPLKSSKALDLLLNPNPYFDMFTTIELTQMYMDLVGKCYWYIAKDRANRPAQIWVISPLNITIIPDRDNFIKGYVYQAGAQRVPLSTDEVIMFKYQDPNNPYNGISPANAAAVPLESDKYAATWNRNFFYNNAEPQGIVSFPDGVEEDDFKAWIEKWNDKYGGLGNAKKTAFIRGGQVSYTAIQISQKDMDFYNLRLSNRDEILGIFGVPKSILGIVEDVNRANAEASEYTYMKHTISPKIKRIQNKLNNEFVQLFGEEDVELRFTDVVPENKDFIKSVVDSQTDKSITKNEARNIINKLLGLKLEPMEGGDVIYQPVSLQPMGTPIPIVANANKEPTQEPQKGIKKKQYLLKLKSKFQSLDKEAYWKAFVNKTDQWEKELKPEWEAILIHQKERIISNIKAHKSTKALNKDDILRFLFGKDEAGYMLDKMLPALKKIIEDKGNQIMDELETNISFDLHNPMVTDWLSKYCGTQITNINTTTETMIREQLKAGEEAGESTTELCDRIAQYFDNMKDYRVQRIARTEVIGASNNASLMGYKQSGVVDNKEWLTAIDERTREWHREADGQTVGIDEKFIVAGEDMDCPGDGGASAENVVNCRCTIIPNFDKESNDNQRMSNPSNDEKMPIPGDKISDDKLNEYINNLKELEVDTEGFENYCGDTKVLDEITQLLSTLIKQYPNAQNNLILKYKDFNNTSDFAETIKNTITLNKRIYDDSEFLKNSYDELSKSGFFTSGTDYRAIISHEFGHLTTNICEVSSRKLIKHIMKYDYNTINQCKIDDIIKNNLSEYATNNYKETIAEAFAEYYNSDKPRELSKTIINQFNAKIEESD